MTLLLRGLLLAVFVMAVAGCSGRGKPSRIAYNHHYQPPSQAQQVKAHPRQQYGADAPPYNAQQDRLLATATTSRQPVQTNVAMRPSIMSTASVSMRAVARPSRKVVPPQADATTVVEHDDGYDENSPEALHRAELEARGAL
jgi:hypothetical protein